MLTNFDIARKREQKKLSLCNTKKGRPRKPASERKDFYFQCRLTERQKHILTELGGAGWLEKVLNNVQYVETLGKYVILGKYITGVNNVI